jgi:hypothetical protein
LDRSPWEELKEQVVLGGEEFLNGLQVSGDKEEQRAARRLAIERPGWADVIKSVERVKGEQWKEFRDRHGDSGRDLVLYLGRRACGMKLSELAEAAAVGSYAVAAMAVRRYESELKRSSQEREQLLRVTQLLNFKM